MNEMCDHHVNWCTLASYKNGTLLLMTVVSLVLLSVWHWSAESSMPFGSYTTILDVMDFFAIPTTITFWKCFCIIVCLYSELAKQHNSFGEILQRVEVQLHIFHTVNEGTAQSGTVK